MFQLQRNRRFSNLPLLGFYFFSLTTLIAIVMICIYPMMQNDVNCCSFNVFRYYPAFGFQMSAQSYILNSMQLIFSKRSKVFQNEDKKLRFKFILQCLILLQILYAAADTGLKYYQGCNSVVDVHPQTCQFELHPIFELTSYFYLLILMIFINVLQWRYFNKHINRKKLTESKEKTKLLIATSIYALSLLYRVIYNLLKLAIPRQLIAITNYGNVWNTTIQMKINQRNILDLLIIRTRQCLHHIKRTKLLQSAQ
eukprot:403338475